MDCLNCALAVRLFHHPAYEDRDRFGQPVTLLPPLSLPSVTIFKAHIDGAQFLLFVNVLMTEPASSQWRSRLQCGRRAVHRSFIACQRSKFLLVSLSYQLCRFESALTSARHCLTCKIKHKDPERIRFSCLSNRRCVSETNGNQQRHAH